MTERAGLHYQLEAYVCGPACIKPSPFEGWATFAQIFNARPDGCRFAVARMVPVFAEGPDGPFVVWDLRDAGVHPYPRALNFVRPPHPTWQGDTADGMIMKAMALYEKI